MSTVLSWGRERLGLGRFGLLAVYLGLMASGGVGAWWWGALSAWCMVTAFRIWDDIADRERDAHRAPDRVLLGVESLAPFWWTSAAALAAGGAGALYLGGTLGLATLVGTALCLGILYRLRLGGKQHWVLLKYPLVVAALGGTDWTQLLTVYLSFAIFERIDDRDLAQATGAGIRLGAYLIAIGAAAAAREGLGIWLALWGLCAGLSLFAQHQGHRRLAPTPLVFSLILGVFHV